MQSTPISGSGQNFSVTSGDQIFNSGIGGGS